MTTPTESAFLFTVIVWLFIGGVHFIAWKIDTRKKKDEMARTPVTEKGLTQFDDLPAGLAVALAWAEPGNQPTWHHRMQSVVRAQMPVLARALDRLVDNEETSKEKK